MSGFTLCFVYLLIAVCNVHSASYYYRAGRELVVPVAEEVIVAEEVRKQQDPVIAIETLEVVPAELVNPVEKVATVAETVKNAAVEAVRSQNEESIAVLNDVKPVEIEPVIAEAVNIEPVNVALEVAAIKTDTAVRPGVAAAAAAAAVVPDVVELHEPSVNAVQEVIEEVKSAPLSQNGFPIVRQNPLEAIQNTISNAVQNFGQTFSSLPVISNFVRPQVQQVQNAQDIAQAVQQADPAAQSQLPNSVDAADSALAPAPSAAAGATLAGAAASTTARPNLFQNALNSITSFLPSATSAAPQLANSVGSAESAPAAAGGGTPTLAAASTTAPPNLFQNALQSITSFLQQRSTTTMAPITQSAPAAQHVSGTKGGNDDNDAGDVLVEQYVTVDDKVDGIKKVIQKKPLTNIN